MKTEKIRMGIVGAGTWGETHAAIYREHVLAQPVAICDVNEQRARAIAEKYGIKKMVLVRKWGDRQLNQMSNSPLILTSRFV